MTNRFASAMLFTAIGAAVATAITAVTAASAFLAGVYIGGTTEGSKNTEK